MAEMFIASLQHEGKINSQASNAFLCSSCAKRIKWHVLLRVRMWK